MMKSAIRTLLIIISFTMLILNFSCVQKPQKKAVDKIDFVLDWKALSLHSGYFVAKDKGFYAEENLDVTILDGTGAPDNAKIIGTGKYNIGSCSGSATVIGKSQGMPIISLAALYQKAPTVIFSLKEKGITKPEDMIGKTLGARYESSQYKEYTAMMNKLGIDKKKVKEVGIGFELQPLLTGQVDMMMGYTDNQPVQVEVQGKEVNRIAVADYGVNLYATNIIANEDFLKKNPDLVKRFMRATMKGWQYTVEHPEEAAAIFLKSHPEQDPKFANAMLSRTIPLLLNDDTKKFGIGYQTYQGWEMTQNTLYDLHLIDKKTELNQMYTNDYFPTKGPGNQDK